MPSKTISQFWSDDKTKTAVVNVDNGVKSDGVFKLIIGSLTDSELEPILTLLPVTDKLPVLVSPGVVIPLVPSNMIDIIVLLVN